MPDLQLCCEKNSISQQALNRKRNRYSFSPTTRRSLLMKMDTQPPKNAEKKKPVGSENERKENGFKDAGSLTESSPTDSRADEKVIVNEQREDQIVNAPSQTAFNDENNGL